MHSESCCYASNGNQICRLQLHPKCFTELCDSKRRLFLLRLLNLDDRLTDKLSSTPRTDTSTLVQNLINSLQQQQQAGSSPSARQVQQADTFTTLPDLLSSSTTIPLLSSFPEPLIDSLLSSLPVPILLLAHHQSSDILEDDNADDEEVTLNSNLSPDEKLGLLMSLSLDQKRQVLAKVLRSPQLHQSLGSLTVALRDGGLPMVASSLGVNVENEGYVRGSAMPLGGGEAVRAFLEGIRKEADKEEDEGDEMDVE